MTTMTFWCRNCGGQMRRDGDNVICDRCAITWMGVPVDAVPMDRAEAIRGGPADPDFERGGPGEAPAVGLRDAPWELIAEEEI